MKERMMASQTVVSFVIDTEITAAYFDELLKFFHQQYILPHQERFANVKRTVVDDAFVLSFTVLAPEVKGYVDVEMRTGKPIQLRMMPNDASFPQQILDQLREDLMIGVQLFEEKVRRTTLYFAFVEGEEVVVEKAPQRRKNIIFRMFSESMLLLFIIFIAASIILFMIFGPFAPVMLVAIQFVMVLISDRVILKMGNWRITKEKPTIHIFQYHLPVDEYKNLQERFNRETLLKIKAEIYKRTFAQRKPLDCQTVDEVFSSYGFKCMPEKMSTKTVNIYEIVEKAAEMFKLPTPKIVVANTILPNAAASGPSPNHGVVLITTGLLVQLEEDEIFSVIGHEFSHLKGRDPLALFGLTAAEYLLRVYVFWPFLYFFGYFYLFFALSAVYFIAKFFESRADLEAAIVIGQPNVLAEALRKIGFRRLQFERLPAYKIQDWIGWDPHPPIYFRVARLEKLEALEKVKHPLIQSIKDNVRGFLAALG